MIRFFILLISIVTFSFVCKSQDTKPSLLYQITNKEGKSAYLFGTVHLLPEEDFLLKPKVLNALHKSDVLVLEVDISDPNMPMKVMELAPMANGDSIQSYLNESQCSKLNQMLMESAGISLPMVQQMKPFMLSSFLVSRYVGSNPASFEFSLLEESRADSLEIIGLETIEDQMAVFDSIPYAVQAESFIEMIEDEEKMKVLFQDIIAAYNSEDANKLFNLLNDNMDSAQEQYFLLEKRNRNWIASISNIIMDQRPFIAVGAGHLGGESGLLKLLEQAGYSIESLPDLSK